MDETAKLACTLCKGEMQEGFFADKGNVELARIQEWYPSPPSKNWFGHIERPMAALKVKSFRCKSCGFLMSFAT